MRKVHILILACVLSACSHNHSNQDVSDLVGYSQSSLKIRQSTISTEDGLLNMTCYLDLSGEESCTGEFEDGRTASEEYVHSLLKTLQIDPEIQETLATGCENKTLLLAIEPKMEIPHIDMSGFCYWDNQEHTIAMCDGNVISIEEAEAINSANIETLNSKISAIRNAGLEQFMNMNPGLVTEVEAQNYRDALYGALNIQLNACDWDAFLNKNQDDLNFIELRASVTNNESPKCNESIEHQVILEVLNSEFDPNLDTEYYKILSSKEELQPYQSIGLKEDIVDKIDFSKDVLLLLSGGMKGTMGYWIQVDDICVDSQIEAQILQCAGKPAPEAMSEPMMFIQLPKNDYEVTFVKRDIICE